MSHKYKCNRYIQKKNAIQHRKTKKNLIGTVCMRSVNWIAFLLAYSYKTCNWQKNTVEFNAASCFFIFFLFFFSFICICSKCLSLVAQSGLNPRWVNWVLNLHKNIHTKNDTRYKLFHVNSTRWWIFFGRVIAIHWLGFVLCNDEYFFPLALQ